MPRHFEIELDQLRTNIIKMGSLVDEQIDLATMALIESNTEKARFVIERDKKADEFDNLIDAQCERIFALTQPVATDLRLIMAALKINHELERMGDIAVNIAERAISLQYHLELLRRSRVIEMSSIAREMVKRAIDSFVNNDPELAREILPKDDLVDNLNKTIFNFLVSEMKSDPSIIEPAAHIIVLSRHLERLADHATNISEEVVYLVDAKIVKHHAEQ
ncbi:MAG TPA: phosphate signaling complex protein PhoU [Bacteroidota bacterium]|nr:phosphate signaling complex protein PhoU [Bacteroidota bacterium]